MLKKALLCVVIASILVSYGARSAPAVPAAAVGLLQYQFIGILVLSGIIAGIIAGIQAGGRADHAVMEEFVRNTCTEMSTNWPEHNYLVWHNHGNHPREFLHKTTHNHTELDVPFGGTEGYEIHAFESGEFIMEGDRGWMNWGFGGNFIRDPPWGSHIKWRRKRKPQAYTRSVGRREARESTLGKDDDILPAWNSALHQKPEVFQRAPKPASHVAAPPSGTSPSRSVRSGDMTKSANGHVPNDGSYFVYCNSTRDLLASSGVAYYHDMRPGQNIGQLPNDLVWVEQNHNPFFRKSTGAVEFLGGAAAVHWDIFGNAMGNSTQPGDLAGVADDGLDNFFIYKDEGLELFDAGEYRCFSQYYAY